MTKALVLAAPERKRILRELLAEPEPWAVAQRNLYRQMIMYEYVHCMELMGGDLCAEALEEEVFKEMIVAGWPLEDARIAATQAGPESDKAYRRAAGQRERARRREFREAVTANDGALAVTTGLVTTCIICGGPFYRGIRRRHRRDSAYCSDACRQAAYRRRRARGQE
jgi:hypothetical protein